MVLNIFKYFKFLLLACFLVTLSSCSTLNKKVEDFNILNFNFLKKKDESSQALFVQLKGAIDGGSYETALEILDKLELKVFDSSYNQYIILNRAFVYYKLNEKTKALFELDKFIEIYPSSDYMDYALYLKVLVHLNTENGVFYKLRKNFNNLEHRIRFGEFEAKKSSDENFVDHEAFDISDPKTYDELVKILKQLIDTYPKSAYAASARKYLDNIVFKMAAYEFKIALFYYNKQAYLAALNRAKNIIKEYEVSLIKEKALALIYWSYKKLEMYDLMKETLAQIKKEYPNSPYLEKDFVKNKINLF